MDWFIVFSLKSLVDLKKNEVIIPKCITQMYSVYYTKKIQAVIQAVVGHKSRFTRDPLFLTRMDSHRILSQKFYVDWFTFTSSFTNPV